jgi:hypothetical protein
MALEGDRDRTVLAMIAARAWRDSSFRQQFVTDPKSVLAQEGVDVPDGVDVKVVEDTDTIKYLNISRDAEEADPQRIASTIKLLLPIPAGHELRLVQSTDTTRYLVLPLPPAGVDPSQHPEPHLMAMAADAAVQSTYQVTTQTVAAESTEVTVTETSAVQDAEAATTVVAVAELVAT